MFFFFQAHEIVSLEILFLLLQNPTDDSVEIAVGFLKECGQKLTEISPKAIHGRCAVCERNTLKNFHNVPRIRMKLNIFTLVRNLVLLIV